MKTYAIILSYDGTKYSGWQVQPNAPSIQQSLNVALSTALAANVYVVGSGRTDAGVHAFTQVAHFTIDTEIDPRRLTFQLNGLLPPDIRIKKVVLVPNSFHSRFSCIGKSYSYFLHFGHSIDPFYHLYRTHIFDVIDIDRMKAGAQHLIGTHDFRAFANENQKGAANSSPIKTIYSIEFHPIDNGIRIEFSGNGFLYKMVRNMVGCLILCGKGKITPEALLDILISKDRKRFGAAAPAKGLFLHSIRYPEEFASLLF